MSTKQEDREGFTGFLSMGLGELFSCFKCLFPHAIDFELLDIHNKRGDYPRINKTINAAVGKQYVIDVPIGLSIDNFIQKQKAIENCLKSRVKIELAQNYKVIITEIHNNYAASYTPDYSTVKKDMKFKLGVSLSGKEITLDLGGTECHTLISGATGSGKSVCLNNLLTQFILKDIQLRLIDLKGGVEFGIYRKCRNVTYFATTPEEAESLLLDTVSLMNRRYKKLFTHEAKSYKDIKGMPPVVVVIDEFSVLDPKDCKAGHKALFELLSRARACNIIVIICTQRPDADILPGKLKCNLKNFISFKVQTAVNSGIALGDPTDARAFTDLRGDGDGIYKVGLKDEFFKGYYLTDAQIKSYIEPYKENKKPPIMASDVDRTLRAAPTDADEYIL